MRNKVVQLLRLFYTKVIVSFFKNGVKNEAVIC